MTGFIPDIPPCRMSTRSWSLENLLHYSKNFRNVPRLSLFDAGSRMDCIETSGTPFIIEGLEKHSGWAKNLFSVDWLNQHGPKDISARDVHTRTDRNMKFDDFISQSRAASLFSEPGEQERMYAKDAECPFLWSRWLHEAGVVPKVLSPESDYNFLCRQPKSIRVETLMCYLGIGDTFTPCHKDLCASFGQNLMCYAEKNGSSFWLMTESSEAQKVSQYFRQIGRELDHENHVVTVDELAQAPFSVFVAEQRPGDLVLIPPRSCHQVLNRGGLTIKMSWSRLTLTGLRIGYYYELPIYRRVCRPEIYRIKSTIYHSLLRETAMFDDSPNELLCKDNIITLDILLQIYDSLLSEEYSPDHGTMICLLPFRVSDETKHTNELIQLVCDFCGADIFQSFFECRECVIENDYDSNQQAVFGDSCTICAGCYAEGRSCKCDNMKPMQYRPFEVLMQLRERAAKALAGHGSPPVWFFDHSIGIFRAACILQKKKGKRELGVCTPKTTRSIHAVSSTWVLSCKKCREGICLFHLLTEQRMHAVDALLVLPNDDSDEQHHLHHTNSSEKYRTGIEGYFSSYAEGSKPDFNVQRIHNALVYPFHRSLNPAFTCPGYYDQMPRNFPDKLSPQGPVESTNRFLILDESTKCDISSQPGNMRNHVSELAGSYGPYHKAMTGAMSPLPDSSSTSLSTSRSPEPFRRTALFTSRARRGPKTHKHSHSPLRTAGAGTDITTHLNEETRTITRVSIPKGLHFKKKATTST